MMLSKSLSVGISVGAIASKVIGNRTRWLQQAEVGFIYQLNKNQLGCKLPADRSDKNHVYWYGLSA
jgi:3-deoxy-D-arabino-heptulosonate 7-phosphate (DAHP) synthase class II